LLISLYFTGVIVPLIATIFIKYKTKKMHPPPYTADLGI
jgi:hypothetical protein